MKTVKLKNASAQDIEEYKRIYRLHLVNCALEDDSDSVSDENLVDFVNNHIDDGDKEWYGLPIRIKL